MDRFETVGGIRPAIAGKARRAKERMLAAQVRLRREARAALSETSGQGTTEYAILVGVLVLMAIVAVVAFRGKLQELWTSITDGINSL